MRKNYYVILGIPSNATQSDIKAAYRRLAKEFHPDHYGQNPTPFQVIHEAYSILSDPQSRRSYDDSIQYSAGERQTRRAEPVHNFHRETVEPLVPDENTTFYGGRSPRKVFRYFRPAFDRIYDDQFSGTILGHRQPENIPVDGRTIEIILSPAQAQRGGTVPLRIPVRIRCPACSGYGYSRYSHCRRCHGAGVLPGEKTMALRYPAGIRENQMVRFGPGAPDTGKIIFTVVFKIR
ncbi:J domain-containing protein [Desulfopila sp. IMCC35006]|uniref:DnaJ domain-containing protein n=1 Tax=Desulfopila sp. IMCC35006 TaxID=2569542 RepID=UPI0010AD474C|nr:DnaJ domain-containing protein [Desulfopila sp. IMCC35006]TKB25134.1 J domain-containing protein [Desulfopila sp. IMCC35006]